MEFQKPEVQRVIDLINNNKALNKYLTKKGLLLTIEDYYDTYGSRDSDDAETAIQVTNEDTIQIIANLLLENNEEIVANSAKDLAKRRFLKKEIEKGLGYSVNLRVEDLQQIFYTYKYSYVESFFENNKELFIPEYDLNKLEENPGASAFVDALLKEFDKMSDMLDRIPDFSTYEEIPFEYINYLTQLIGLDQQMFMIADDQEWHFREIARNIIDIYKIKGSMYAYQLFFDFLGFDINVVEYFFDRRLFFQINDENEETKTNLKDNYKYYLTANDPRFNIIEKLSSDETITSNNLGQQQNIFDFDDYVTDLIKMGNSKTNAIKIMLGYHSEYKDRNGNILTWEGPVYTYFRTNYITFTPARKYSDKNFTIEQSFQITKLLNFLTPIFIQREVIVDVSKERNDEQLWLNWNYDGFYMLDGEDWDTSLQTCYQYDCKGTSPVTYRKLMPNGSAKTYTNSLGCSYHMISSKSVVSDVNKYSYTNVFKMPIDSRILTINTNRYWGDTVRPSVWGSTGKGYAFASKLTNYWVERCNGNGELVKIDHCYSLPINKKEATRYGYAGMDYSNLEPDLYWPRDREFANENVRKHYECLKVVDGNGYDFNTIKNAERKANPFVEVDWVTDLSIGDFLKNENNEYNDKHYNKEFFEKGWNDATNNVWNFVKNIEEKNVESFVNRYNNVLNYDYVNKKLITDNYSIENLTFTKNGYGYSMGQNVTTNLFSNLLNNSCDSGFLILKKQGENKYSLYHNTIYDLERLSISDICCVFEYNNLKEACRYNDALVKKAFDTCKKNIASSYNDAYSLPYMWRPSIEMYDVNNSTNCSATSFSTLYNCFSGYSLYTRSSTTCIVNCKFTVDDLKTRYNSYYVLGEKKMYIMKKILGNTKYITNNKRFALDTETFNMQKDVTREEISKNGEIGQFKYINNVFKDSDGKLFFRDIKEFDTSNPDEYIWFRENHLLRYTYLNRRIGQLIYSTKDEKMYIITGEGYCEDNNIFGVKPINYTGKLVIDGNKGIIYEYDKHYHGFNEKEDYDNYLMLNYRRHVIWPELGLDLGIIDRPVKQNTDNLLYVKDEEGKVTNEIDDYKIKKLLNIEFDESFNKFIYDEIEGK